MRKYLSMTLGLAAVALVAAVVTGVVDVDTILACVSSKGC